MDPTNIFQQSWATSVLAPSPTPQSSQNTTPQLTPYGMQSATNFAGSIPTGSATYQQQSSAPRPSPSPSTGINPAAISYFPTNGNVGTPTNPPANGTPNSTSTNFYQNQTTFPFYYSSVPVSQLSQYSSLSGATNAGLTTQKSGSSVAAMTPSAGIQSSSLASALGHHSPPPPQQQQQPRMVMPSQLSFQSLVQPQQPAQAPPPSTTTPSAMSTMSMAIDPSLIASNNPYLYRSPFTAGASAGSNNPPTYNAQSVQQAQHQFMQSPSVISPAMLMRPQHGYSNSLANRSAINPSAPPVASSPPIPAHTPSLFLGSQPPFSDPPATPPAASLTNYQTILTNATLDKAPETTANSFIAWLKRVDWNDIDPASRMEILTKLRDHAASAFLEVFMKSSTAMETLRDWLKATLTKKQYDDTLMPLLQVIDRLPFGVNELSASKLGKIMVKVAKEGPSSATKDVAKNIELKWRKLVEEAGSNKVKTEDDARAKKRKIEATPPKSAPPSKKAAVAPTTATKPAAGSATVVKKVVPTSKETKPDTSFFSQKPKAKLPSFRKPAASANSSKKEDDAAVAQPSSIDPFQEAMKAMGKSVGSPVPTTEVAAVAIATTIRESTPTVTLGKNGKPKKRVTFQTDDKLVQVKLIERAVYDDDPSSEGAHHFSYRDLDIDEGQALHAVLFEEQLDWYEPLVIDLTADPPLNIARGTESTEIATQEERENTSIMAAYMPDMIPETPSDDRPGMDGPPDESSMVVMSAGAEVDQLEAPLPPPPQQGIQPSISDLLAKIAGTSGPNFIGNNGFGGGNPYGVYSEDTEMTWNDSGNDGYGQQGGAGDSWNSGPNSSLPPPAFNDGQWGDGPHPPTGPRARNRPPRPRIPIPCKFYNTPGGCRNGQNCQFIHS